MPTRTATLQPGTCALPRRPLTLPDLMHQAAAHRAACGCGERMIQFRPRCHPKAGSRAVFCEDCGVLHLICVECEKFVADVAVAKEAS